MSSELVALAERSASGDRGALATLLRHLAPRMLRTANAVLHSREDAEDATQEAMLALSRSLANLAEPRAVQAYASRVVLRVALRSRGKRERRQSVLRDETTTTQGAHALLDPHARVEQRRKVDRALNLLEKLPEEQAEVMVMRFVEGYTVAEVADAMGISIHTVTSRVRLAKRRLRRMVKRLKLQGGAAGEDAVKP